jgi:hypothetical protein
VMRAAFRAADRQRVEAQQKLTAGALQHTEATALQVRLGGCFRLFLRDLGELVAQELQNVWFCGVYKVPFQGCVCGVGGGGD